jgi:ubiquinone/menaquinone biosynthesis C-methylase UbiE
VTENSEHSANGEQSAVPDHFEPTKRFTGLATVYAAGRPDYPDSAIEFIIKSCKLSNDSVIADVGCGTGISSRLFADRGIRVIAIEPNADMREQARRQGGTEHGRQPEFIEGEAEATTLGNASVDVVLAAQAFHWFRPEEAIAEFCRILKKDGWISLMWNERDESDAFTGQYGTLLRTFPNTTKVEGKRHKAGLALLTSSQVKNGSVNRFKHSQPMGWECLQQRAHSTSYAPKEPPERDVLVDGLRKLFDSHQVDGCLTMHLETSVYLAQPRREGL